MRNDTAKPLTASQELLLGAADLESSGKKEFSEWDWSVAVWKRNKNRFGCRGYEDYYPDHKRVSMEFMARTKKENPIRRGLVVKVKTNTYALTDTGRAEAARLHDSNQAGGASLRAPQSIYDAVAPFCKNSVFRRHTKDPDEPRMWLSAASFYQMSSPDPLHVTDRLREAETAIKNAAEWMDENGVEKIHRGVSSSGKAGGAITRNDVDLLRKFDRLLRSRFSKQLKVIEAALKKEHAA